MIRLLVLCYNNVPAMLSGHSLLAILDHLDPERFRPFVAFNRPCDMEKEVARRGIGTAVFPHGGGSLIRKGWQYGRLPWDLWCLSRRFRPDLVYADNLMAGRDGAILKALAGLPLVVHLRNIGWFDRTEPFVRKADRFTAVSRATIEGMLPAGLQSRASVVLDGIDLRRFTRVTSAVREDSRRALGVPAGCRVVGMAARLSPQKGQRYFIDAAKRICGARDDVVFVHAGQVPRSDSPDPYERFLEEEGRALKDSGRFIWLGYVERIERLWAAVDVAVLPSCAPEALGLVLLEAMASRVPVVSTTVGGPEEVIDTPEVGRLVSPGDGESLARAVELLLDDEGLRRRLGEAGRERVEKVFSAPVFAARMASVFEEAAAGAGSDSLRGARR